MQRDIRKAAGVEVVVVVVEVVEVHTGATRQQKCGKGTRPSNLTRPHVVGGQ